MGSGCISDFAVIVHRQYPAKRVAENEMNGNILDINQTIMQGHFTMIMMVDLAESDRKFVQFKDELVALGEEMGMVITCMHQDLFQFMHRI